MERKRVLPVTVLLFTIGAATLSRFSHEVRAVNAVGLSGGGFAIGVGFTLLLLGLAGRLRV